MIVVPDSQRRVLFQDEDNRKTKREGKAENTVEKGTSEKRPKMEGAEQTAKASN